MHEKISIIKNEASNFTKYIHRFSKGCLLGGKLF